MFRKIPQGWKAATFGFRSSTAVRCKSIHLPMESLPASPFLLGLGPLDAHLSSLPRTLFSIWSVCPQNSGLWCGFLIRCPYTHMLSPAMNLTSTNPSLSCLGLWPALTWLRWSVWVCFVLFSACFLMRLLCLKKKKMFVHCVLLFWVCLFVWILKVKHTNKSASNTEIVHEKSKNCQCHSHPLFDMHSFYVHVHTYFFPNMYDYSVYSACSTHTVQQCALT